MTGNGRPSGCQDAGFSVLHAVKVLLTHAAAVAVLLVTVSGPAWADAPSGGSAEPRGESATTTSSSPQESFGNTPPPKDQNAADQAPKKAMGGGKSSFADGPPKPPGTPQPGAARENGNAKAEPDPIKVRVRKGDLEVDVEVPEGKPNNRPVIQPRKKNGEKAHWAVEYCKKAENRQKCKNMEDLAKKEQEKALNQRNAGKEATGGLDRVQKQAQTGLETAVDNMGRAVKAIDQLGPGATTQDVDAGAVDLGESDTLGELD